MLDTDKEIYDYVNCYDGIYMRCSDDFIIVILITKEDFKINIIKIDSYLHREKEYLVKICMRNILLKVKK